MLDFVELFFTLAPLGLALIAIGLVQILSPRSSAFVRLTAAGMFLAAALATSWALTDLTLFAVLAFGIVLSNTAIALTTLVGNANRFASRSRYPLVSGFAIAGFGATILGIACLRYDADLSDQVDRDSGDLELMTYVPERVEDHEYLILTDRGRTIPMWRPKDHMTQDEVDAKEIRCLKQIGSSLIMQRLEPANDLTNCHGWVFTGGRSVMTNSDIETILVDNGYRTVERPVPGDIVIYRDPEGQINHTAIVSEIVSDQSVIVDSKWSWMGVFRHHVDKSNYGQDYKYYRTDRGNHIVRTIDRASARLGGAE